MRRIYSSTRRFRMPLTRKPISEEAKRAYAFHLAQSLREDRRRRAVEDGGGPSFGRGD